jgi:hypothetical protein
MGIGCLVQLPYAAWSGARMKKRRRGCVDVVLGWDSYVSHGIGIDECETDNI